MDINEAERELESVDFVNGLRRTHSRMAKNGNNVLRLVLEKDFPSKLWVQRLNVKRVVNNLITNALKHTNFGLVVISINLGKYECIKMDKNWILVGSKPIDNLQ